MLCARLRSCCSMPLKRVEPFVVRVDNSTGVVDVVPVYAGTARSEQTVTRYFLTHYVSVCERFNFATAESDYEECGAFHAAQRNQAWYALWNPNNPDSPLNVHKDGSTVRVQVEAVSFFSARKRRHRSRAGALPEGERQGGGATSASRTGSRPSSTPTPPLRRIRGCGAGIRSASRSWSLPRSLRYCLSRHPRNQGRSSGARNAKRLTHEAGCGSRCVLALLAARCSR